MRPYIPSLSRGQRTVDSPSLLAGIRVREVGTTEVVGLLTELERKFVPHRLWAAGTVQLPLPHPRVAIVGTRQPSAEGRERAGAIAARLAGAGVTVISGLARGVDTAAHTAALNADGSTIAVIGTPLSRA